MNQEQQQLYSYAAPPAPVLNGGLYTGAPFQPDAPWRNFPAVPDGTYMTQVNLQSASPPPGALVQHQGSTRPGNNYQILPNSTWFSNQHSIVCVRQDQKQQPPATNTANTFSTNNTLNSRFAAFYYL
jgi:hypothetical protein